MSLKPYSVGGPTGDARRLHLNEFRFPHAETASRAIRAELGALPDNELLSQYPEDPSRLREALAGYLGVASKCIALSAGSDESLRAAIDTAAYAGLQYVVVGVPTYTHFAHFARLSGRALCEYSLGARSSPEEQSEHMVALYLEELTRGALVYIGNPNNPTGGCWSADAVASLARRFPRSRFLVDEAYIEFAGMVSGRQLRRGRKLGPAARLNSASLAGCATTLPNVVVTRTFSKAFGLAALRVGYAVGSPELVAQLNLALSPKAVGHLAVSGGCAVLRDVAHYARCAGEAVRNARALAAALVAAGWHVPDPSPCANFFLVYAGAEGGRGVVAACVAALRAGGVAVRDRSTLPCLAGFVRITAGTEADAAAVLAAFATLTPPAELPPPTTPKRVIAGLLRLYSIIRKVMDDAGVPFWLHGGTLLGAVRHRGMVPWDDDIDLAYAMPSGADPLAALVEVFASIPGHTLQRNRTDAYWQVGTNAPGEPISDIHVDIFPFVRRGARYVNADPRFSEETPDCDEAHCNTSYSEDELFPLRTVPFYKWSAKIPRLAEWALKRALGQVFMVRARARVGEGETRDFVITDYTPA